MWRYLLEHNSNINCPIIIIFGTVVTETISYWIGVSFFHLTYFVQLQHHYLGNHTTWKFANCNLLCNWHNTNYHYYHHHRRHHHHWLVDELYYKKGKGKGRYSSSWEPHLRATECQLLFDSVISSTIALLRATYLWRTIGETPCSFEHVSCNSCCSYCYRNPSFFN